MLTLCSACQLFSALSATKGLCEVNSMPTLGSVNKSTRLGEQDVDLAVDTAMATAMFRSVLGLELDTDTGTTGGCDGVAAGVDEDAAPRFEDVPIT